MCFLTNSALLFVATFGATIHDGDMALMIDSEGATSNIVRQTDAIDVSREEGKDKTLVVNADGSVVGDLVRTGMDIDANVNVTAADGVGRKVTVTLVAAKALYQYRERDFEQTNEVPNADEKQDYLQLLWRDGTLWTPPVWRPWAQSMFGGNKVIGAEREFARHDAFTLQLCEAVSWYFSDRRCQLYGSKALSWNDCEGVRTETAKESAEEIERVSAKKFQGYVKDVMTSDYAGRVDPPLEDKPHAEHDYSDSESARESAGGLSNKEIADLTKGQRDFLGPPPKTSGADKVGVRVGDKSCRMTFNTIAEAGDDTMRHMPEGTEQRHVVVQLDFTFAPELIRENMH